jgi:hypothetical protein
MDKASARSLRGGDILRVRVVHHHKMEGRELSYDDIS